MPSLPLAPKPVGHLIDLPLPGPLAQAGLKAERDLVKL